MGIASTRLNAELVRIVFGSAAHPTVIDHPTKKIVTRKRVLIGCGWQPGCSTDMDTTLMAKNLGAKTIINLSNVEYVYNKDPKKHPDAKPLEKLSWKQCRSIVGSTWKSGLNAPFDPVASRVAEKLGLKVVVMKGTDLGNLQNLLEGKPFRGTVIG
jgi:uridylate kinase